MRMRAYFLALLIGLAPALPASAALIYYSATLNGANESPPVVSGGTGTALVTYNDATMFMRVQATFSGLTGNTSVAHIHCCTTVPITGTVGVATPTPTFPGFPAGVTSGSYDQTFDMLDPSSFNGAFITANGGTPTSALTALLAGLDEGRAYFNIHTTFAPSGEIRGFMQRSSVPEPSTLTLLGLGLAGLAATRRRKQ